MHPVLALAIGGLFGIALVGAVRLVRPRFRQPLPRALRVVGGGLFVVGLTLLAASLALGNWLGAVANVGTSLIGAIYVAAPTSAFRQR